MTNDNDNLWLMIIEIMMMVTRKKKMNKLWNNLCYSHDGNETKSRHDTCCDHEEVFMVLFLMKMIVALIEGLSWFSKWEMW